MRVKFWEWVFSILLVFQGSSMIQTEDYQIRGHIVYPWFSYLLLFVGIAIPILAWFLRSPSRNQDEE